MMHTAENLKVDTKCNGYENLGKLLHFISKKNVDAKIAYTALKIGEWSLGKLRATTNTPDEFGGNRTITQWAKFIGISKNTFVSHIKQLVKLNIVKVHKGSLYRNGGGSYPDYYSIVFDKELQTKHKLYFNTSGINKKLDKPTTYDEVRDMLFPYNDSMSPDERIARRKEILAYCKKHGIPDWKEEEKYKDQQNTT